MDHNIQTTYKDLPVSELRKEEEGQVVGTASLCPGSDNPAATAAQDNSPFRLRLFKAGDGVGWGSSGDGGRASLNGTGVEMYLSAVMTR